MSKISVISILAKNLEEACHKVNDFKKEVISVVIEENIYKFVVKDEEVKKSKGLNDDYRYLATSCRAEEGKGKNCSIVDWGN